MSLRDHSGEGVWSADAHGSHILTCCHGMGGGCLLVRQTSSGEMAVAALDLVFLYHVLRESFRGPRVAPVGEVPTAIRGPGGPWQRPQRTRGPRSKRSQKGPRIRLRVK